MASLKRFTKTTPTGTATVCYIVSGAGTSGCNGTYGLTSRTYREKPVYSNGSYDLCYAYWGLSWNDPCLLSGVNSYENHRMYSRSEDTSTWVVTTASGHGGDEPAPTVADGTIWSGDPEALFTVASGKADAIVSVELDGGANGGSITLSKNNGIADYMSQTYTLSANEKSVLDYKQFLEAGDSYKVASSATGITVVVNAAEV